ncbi:mobilization protein [Streptomyces atriruber]|uniref:Mobilization protein n=1 Tax=Streptomyces atriruber TaxID=545121 RepID=A0ABV3BX42_9ACTN
MIPSIHQQDNKTIGLLHYLYGPGTSEEHIDPHLVSGDSGGTFGIPDPGRDPQATLKDLQKYLDLPLSLLDPDRLPKKHVWHCSVRAAPEDPILTDEQWGEIAERIVAATGVDSGEWDDLACRWVAVRHADDHIHIVATLVRQDGRRPNLHYSAKRAQAEARLIEADYGLRRVTPGDGTAAKRATSAEVHKAQRLGRDRTARDELRETVRRAVAGAVSTDEFLDRLKNVGLLVRTRVLPSGDLRGYTVALPDDRNGDGEPIYYAGSSLAPDLSLPRIQERFAAQAAPPEFTGDERPSHPTGLSAPATARRSAAHAAWEVLITLDATDGDDGAAAAQIAATGEVLDALAKTSALHTRQELRQAAWEFERASRSHTRAEFRHAQALRRAGRDLVRGGPALGRGEDGAGTAMLIDALVFLTMATAHWHAQRQNAQQAEAARRAAAHLRAAYEQAAAEPRAVLQGRSSRIAFSLLRRHAATVREVLPDLHKTLVAECSWDALVATLIDAERAGHDSRALLAEAASVRELDSADSVSEVLIWRLRNIAGLPGATPATATRANRSIARPVAPARQAPPAPRQPRR